MIGKSMYQRIKYFKGQGLTKSEIVKETGLDFKTVSKYYRMSEDEFRRYLAEVRYRTRVFDPFKETILDLYRENGFRRLPKASVYDYLEEVHGDLPGTERTFRNYIDYLEETGQLEFNTGRRLYTPVPELPFGKQMQIDLGQFKLRNGLKLYIFAAVLSASRYRYCSVQGRAFTTTDLIAHLLDCFRFFGGRPQEMVIDQDRLMVVSENHGDIVYTRDFSCFIEEMELNMFVCRKADPETKGKIENLVKFVKNSFFKVRKNMSTLDEVQDRLLDWLARRANGKISAATKRVPAELVVMEREHLRPLKASIFQKDSAMYREVRLVDKVGRISVGASKYPVPATYRHRAIEIFKTQEKLFLFDIKTGQQVAELSLELIPGTLAPFRERYREKESKLQELKVRLLQQFRFKAWREFVEKNYQSYRRYFRDQYREFTKRLAGGVEPGILKQALRFCLENGTYSMLDLSDTYVHFKRESERGAADEFPAELVALREDQKRAALHGRDIQVARRDPAAYQAILSSGQEAPA